MKNLLACALALTVPLVSFADGPTVLDAVPAPHSQSSDGTGSLNWSGGFVYDTKLHTIDAIVINSVAPITVHGKGIGVAGALFAGTTTDKNGHSIAGALLIWQHQLVDQINVSAGLGGGYLGGSGFRFLVEFGATVKF